jgi:hypothetical protein
MLIKFSMSQYNKALKYGNNKETEHCKYVRLMRQLKKFEIYELIAYEFQNAMVERVENAKIAKQTRNTDKNVHSKVQTLLCGREV